MPAPDPNAPLHATPPRRTQPHSWLRAFSDALARRLPGSWNAATTADFPYSPVYADVRDRLWDAGHVHWALQGFVHDEAALLDGPGNETFVVLPRPHHRGQFLVAALAPTGIDGTLRTDHAPHGIAVPGEPVRAAADTERRLLPRYRKAVEATQSPALRAAHRRAQEALDDWDAVSDSFCDEQGFPYDEDAYGIRQAQRDAEAWNAFETFLVHGPAVIEQVNNTLTTLNPPPDTAKRWNYQLRALTDALTEGTLIRDTWEPHLAAIVNRESDPDRWRAFNDALDARNAEGWSAVSTFIDHAPVLETIRSAEQHHGSAETARLAAAQARTTITVSESNPAFRLPPPDAHTASPRPPTRPHPPAR